MNHPTADELLLLAYDELPADRLATVETHLTSCVLCQEQLADLERGRAALEVAMPARPRRAIAGAAVALAVAAALAGVAIVRSTPVGSPGERWTPTTTWSTTAGYVTGGNAMLDIDAQLTRLERERYYGLPN
jgi:hypothetical protein